MTNRWMTSIPFIDKADNRYIDLMIKEEIFGINAGFFLIGFILFLVIFSIVLARFIKNKKK